MAYCGDGGTVTYGMIGPGSHFCTHIGRMHRSNHIYLLLDFATGGYCQKCYDPDCAGELGGAAARDVAMLTVRFEGHHCQKCCDPDCSGEERLEATARSATTPTARVRCGGAAARDVALMIKRGCEGGLQPEVLRP